MGTPLTLAQYLVLAPLEITALLWARALIVPVTGGLKRRCWVSPAQGMICPIKFLCRFAPAPKVAQNPPE